MGGLLRVLNQSLYGSAHHLWLGATYLLKKSLEDTGDIVRRVPGQLYQCSAILKGLAQPLHTYPRPTDPIDTLQGKGYLACDLAISGDRSLVGTIKNEDVTYLQAQGTVLYLSCASGNHKGHLLREISGEL